MTDIVQDGAPVLRQEAEVVPATLFGSEKLAGILADMEKALDAEPDGVALAAPQIGIALRIFLVRYDRMRPLPAEGEAPYPKEVGVFINPKIVRTSRRRVEVDEGCLSVRGVYGKTERFERATVHAEDETGKRFERGGGGVLAQAFQHEIDHLDGILFIDHATSFYEIHRHEDV